MRLIFLGTPDFAVPSLEKIANSKHEILCVITQPDKPRGRNGEVSFSPVKEYALKHGLKVLQYNKIRFEGVEDLKALKPDIMVTCAFGQILSQEIIDIAPHGIINVHGSLLPKYRGASPIQWSILNGDKETGITIMKTEAGIDTGDILFVKKTPIKEDETAGELFDRLSVLGAEMIVDALDKIEAGDVHPQKQDDSQATVVKMLKKEDGEINWNDFAEKIYNQVRGMNPWPSAYTFLNGKMLKIHSAKVSEESGDVGKVLKADKQSLSVGCGKGSLEIKTLQLEGSKKMDYYSFLLGRKIEKGDILGVKND